MPNEARDPDWERMIAEKLIAAAQSATSRTRLIFLFVNVAGAIILCAQGTATFSWLRWTVSRAKEHLGASDVIYQQLVSSVYRDLYVIGVPVLGIKVSVTDIQIYGSAAMAVLATWWFYSVRRENHVIADLIHEAKRYLPEHPDAALAYFYGLVHHFVFTTTTKVDTPNGEQRQEVRWAVKALALMPVWVPLFVIALDVVSLAFVNLAGVESSHPLWGKLSKPEQWEAVTRDAIALVLAMFCLRLWRLGNRFDASTRGMMEAFGNQLTDSGLTRGARKRAVGQREQKVGASVA